MPMSCQCDVNHNDMLFMKYEHQKMSCHLIPMWHEWNANVNDVMMTWFALDVNPGDVTMGMHDMWLHAWHMYSRRTSMSKYLSGLA